MKMLDKHCLMNNDTNIPLYTAIYVCVSCVFGKDNPCWLNSWSAKSVYFPSKSLNSLTTIDITLTEGN